jgi:beta-phosphoglucomutase-like phosphatase (HAD superfamily)
MAFEILTAADAADTLSEDEYVFVSGPPDSFPAGQLFPLAPKRLVLDEPPAAILLDMDGTLTSTEPIFLLAMERALASMVHETWEGLDSDVDHPALIGLSTTENIRYLSNRYGHLLSMERFEDSIRWTCSRLACHQPDTHLRVCAEQLLGIDLFESLAANRRGSSLLPGLLANEMFRQNAARLVFDHEYHSLLHGASELSQAHPVSIEPLPAVGLLLAIVKGLLGPEAAALSSLTEDGGGDVGASSETLASLGACFARWKPPVGLVTSSSHREASIVLDHLFRHLRDEVRQWPIPASIQQAVLGAFSAPESYFNIVITASDCPEMRLKPQRDLYSLALYGLGLEPQQFQRVIGVEDTEAGVIALRAAGVSVACALPLPESQGQDFRAASCVARGGMAELLVVHRLCLAQELLTAGR